MASESSGSTPRLAGDSVSEQATYLPSCAATIQGALDFVAKPFLNWTDLQMPARTSGTQ